MSDERQEVSPEQYQLIKAELGIEGEQFKRTKLGQFIFDTIEREEENLIEDLIATASRSTDAELQRLCNEIYKRRILPMFIDEAISAGRAAEKNLAAMEAASTDY
jgi:hypothetical protein